MTVDLLVGVRRGDRVVVLLRLLMLDVELV